MKDKQKNITKRSKTRARVEDRERHFPAFLFLGITISLAYAVSLNGTWAMDDDAIRQFVSIEKVLNFRLGYRKVAYLSFLINQWINPSDPLNYRALNILIHIFNSILVYVAAFLTLRLPALKEKYGGYSFPTALISSVIFALHPININGVAYIVQRMASLATMFVLLALLTYISARTSDNNRLKSAAFYILTVIFVLLGIFSKENAVMALPLIFLYDYFFLVRSDARGLFVKLFAGIAIGLIIFAVSSFFLQFHKAILSIFGSFLKLNQQITPQGWTAVDVYWTPLQHFLTEFRVIGRYLFLLFLPLPRFLVFDWWGFPISTGITEPVSTLISLILIAGAISFSVCRFRKLPFLSFGVLWYFLAVSLESFIAIGSDLYYEHRNYLPFAGLVIGVTAQIMTIFKVSALKRSAWIIALLLSVTLGSLTVQRNLVWRDSITLWKDTVEKAPGNLRAVVALGNAYLKASDLYSARDCYKKAVEDSASGRGAFFHNSIYGLGMVSLFLGDLAHAKEALEVMEAKSKDPCRTGILKGFYDSLSGDPGVAIAEFNRILPQTTEFDRVIVYTLIGDSYRKAELPDKAIENYKKALGIDPSFSAAYYGMGDSYLSLRDLGNSADYIEKSLALDPRNPLALSAMADILLIRKEPPEKAMSYADRAVSNSPPFYQPYLAMGNVMIVMGKEAEAEGFFMKARERGLKDYMVPFSKARAYYMKGERKKAETLLQEVASMRNIPENLRRTVEESLKKM